VKGQALLAFKAPAVLSPAGRAAAYARAFPQYPDSHFRVSERWCTAHWMLGNSYRGSGYYGAYPPGLLKRLWALYPDLDGHVLHICSGSLKADVRGVRLDLRHLPGVVEPDVRGSVTAMPFLPGSFWLGIADPPYGTAQAVNYGTPMPSRRRTLQQAHAVIAPGGQLAWLDTQLPMFRKADWHNWGQVCVVRSTNHAVRLLSLFERQ
jgi:hypothetical protein